MAKKALLIGVSQYEAGLPPLAAAPKDVAAMLRVLESSELGDFDEVKTLIDPDLEAMQTAIDLLFQSCQKGDLGLLYFSGHGITDDSDRLYLATRRTSKDTFRSTAVSASFIDGIMHEHHHQRQLVLILDCCYAGAFTGVWHSKGMINLKSQFKIEEGRVLMASCGSLEKSYEDKEGELSLYTKYLVQGLESGEADKDLDGFISTDELHEYTKRLVESSKSNMKPEMYSFKHGNKILISKVREVTVGVEKKVLEPYSKLLKKLDRYKIIITLVILAVTGVSFYLYQNFKTSSSSLTPIANLNEAIRLGTPSSIAVLNKIDEVNALISGSTQKIAKKDYQGAITDLNKAILLEPDSVYSYAFRGQAKFALGDDQGAIDDLNKTIILKPNDANMYYHRGSVKSALGDKQGAIADLNESIRLKPDAAHAYFDRGLVKNSLGDTQAGKLDLLKAAELFKQQGNIEQYNLIMNSSLLSQ